MEIFIPIILVIIPIIIANFIVARGNETIATLFEAVLAILNIPLILIGLLFFIIPSEVDAQLSELGLPILNWEAAGWVTIFMALWAILACVRPLRRVLARIIPLDPTSPVHTLALVLAGYLIGNTLFALGQDVLLEIADSELNITISDIILQQFAFVIVAFIGSGILIRRDFKLTNKRLGLERPTMEQLLWGLVVIVVLIIIQWAVGIIWVFFDPDQAAALGEVNDLLLGNVDTLGEWFILALASGVGEEILFRGAIQPVFGVVATSLLFAVVHVQYGLSPITAAVFIIGLILGILRQRTNTTTTIFVHFSYNFILGIFALLASYVQEFIG